jgi:hypothetical protein
MRIDESLKICDATQQQLADHLGNMERIFTELKLIKPEPDLSEVKGPTISKYAASAVIADSHTFSQLDTDPIDLKLAVQLNKQGEKIRVCFPGGAIQSEQETEWTTDPANAGKPVPPNLFYMVAERELVERASRIAPDASRLGELNFTYHLDGFEDVLRRNLRRELGEELGGIADEVHIRDFLPGERRTVLTSIGLPSADRAGLIAERLAKFDVTPGERPGMLKGVYTTVVERAAAAQGDTSRLANLAEENSEAKGIMSISLRDFLTLCARTTETEKSYSNFKDYWRERGSEQHTDGIRNPSTIWAAQLFLGWLAETIKAQDTYRIGALHDPFKQEGTASEPSSS